MQIDFASSRQSTLGVEWEVALVDRHTSDLHSVAEEVLAELNLRHGLLAIDEEHPHVKQELLLNTVEIGTGVCETAAQVKAQLHENLVAPRGHRPDGCRPPLSRFPFALPTLQPVTDKDRYAKMIDRTQGWGQQLVIYGVHVHVGWDSRAKALSIVDGLINYQAHF